GGMASGGMVLVLDDMVNEGNEIVTTGIVNEFVDRMEKQDGAVYPPPEDLQTNWDMWQKWSRWGCIDFHKTGMPQPIIHAVAFDPDAWKRVSLDLVKESGVNLRLHSWFSEALVEDGKVTGVICQTKLGRQAIRAKMVIDASGDLDVAASAGASFIDGQYIVTTVFRLCDVDTDRAEAFEYSEPEAYKKLDREARRVIGGAWGMWWLKTPLPGIVWCNCPHMPGYDGMSPEDMVAAEYEGRERMMNLLEFARKNIPGFENAKMLGAAEQMGVRQTRLLQGEYVVTKKDVQSRLHFADSVCRGRDYYTPYRALLPKGIDNLIVAGRHYSVDSDAQKMSREIPPCMSQGEAAGIAVSLALKGDCALRDVDARQIQKQMRAQGADPGDVPSANALIEDTVAV
ncbi:MAG: FAD-dependent oxidoreductase, partial [Hyphomicrobiales bacterium]